MRNAGVILGGVIGGGLVLAGIAAVRMPADAMLTVVLVVAGLALVLTVVLVLAWVIGLQAQREREARQWERPRPVAYLVDQVPRRLELPAPVVRDFRPWEDCERLPALPAGRRER